MAHFEKNLHKKERFVVKFKDSDLQEDCLKIKKSKTQRETNKKAISFNDNYNSRDKSRPDFLKSD